MAKAKRGPTTYFVVALLVALSAAPATAGPNRGGSSDSEAPDRGERVEALYNGEVITLDDGWGGASACIVWPEALNMVECFDSETQMDNRVLAIEGIEAVKGGGNTTLGVNCSSYMKLYDGTWYSGQTLYMRSRFQWFNLSTFGFNQKASSYKMGACYGYFADLSWGGGAWYPSWATQAWDKAGTMQSGWNNDVSSVYLG